MPLFSVLVPTKNRSALVGYAVQSALSQTCADLEVVVVDNDDTDATQQVIQRFSDARLRYVRTGGLSMPDNWERAFREAQGEYVTVLTDRMALRPWALDTLQRTFATGEHLIISWGIDVVEDAGPGEIFFTNRRSITHSLPDRNVDAAELIQRFLERLYWDTILVLPKGLNSCCHRSVLERLWRGPAGRVCLATAPDYTFAFQQLAYYDRVLHLGRRLTLSSNRESTGRSGQLKDRVSDQFLKEIGGPAYTYIHVPIKAFFVQNSLINDFMRVRELVSGNLSAYDLPLIPYFINCYQELAQLQAAGINYRVEITAWHAALEEQPAEVRRAVEAAVAPLVWRWRVIGLRNQLFYNWLRQIVKRTKKGRVSPVFPDILAALAWEEQQRKRARGLQERDPGGPAR